MLNGLFSEATKISLAAGPIVVFPNNDPAGDDYRDTGEVADLDQECSPIPGTAPGKRVAAGCHPHRRFGCYHLLVGS